MTTTTWDTDAGDGLWQTDGNWDNGKPGSGDAAVIIGAGTATLAGTMDCASLDTDDYTGAMTATGALSVVGAGVLPPTATITALDCSGGTEVDATGARNGGGNDNVDFGPAVALPTTVAVGRTGDGYDLTDALTELAGGGSTFPNSGKEVLAILNDSGGPVDVTIETTATLDGLVVDDLVVTVPDGQTSLVGPFPPSVYGETVTVTGEQSVDMFASVFRVTPEMAR